MLGYQGGDNRLMGVSSRIRPPVFGAIWLGHPLANGLHMARLEDDPTSPAPSFASAADPG